ncbi:MAG: bacterioferritin [Burkholderiales bacterium]
MPGDPQVIAYLGQVLVQVFTAAHQHLLHSRMFRAWGLAKLAQYEHNESLGAMKYADKLIGRILFLEALPDVQQLGRVYAGENVSEVLKCDLQLSAQVHPVLKQAIAHCETAGDIATRELFEDIMENQAEHREWIEAQLGLIERTGLHRYQQSQI